MAKLLKNPWLLGLVAAIATSLLGYLINQLPEVPNKQQNTPWIIAAAVGITLLVWLVAMLNSQSNSQAPSGARLVVKGNVVKGKGNRFGVQGHDADVSENKVVGEDQQFQVGDGTNSSGTQP